MTERTEKEIEELLREWGYTLIEIYKDKRKRVIIEDKNKYRYDVIFDHRMLSEKRMWFVCPENPYSLKNINRWLEINSRTFTLCYENKYVGKEERNLSFYCSVCDDVFVSCWNDIRSGQGCGVCKGIQTGEKHSFATLRPDILFQWRKTNSISPYDVPIGSQVIVEWECEKGHVWETSVKNRTRAAEGNGTNCPYCAGQRPTPENNFGLLFPELLDEWDYERNGNPHNYLSRTRDYVWWICSECGNRWQAEIQNRTHKNAGCHNCNTSSGNRKIRKTLNNKIKYIDEYRFDECKNIYALPFDFYLPDYNLCIEYHGIQHYKEIGFFSAGGGLKGLKKRDKIKEKFCKDNGINLLVIPYTEFDNIEQILIDTLNSLEEGGN